MARLERDITRDIKIVEHYGSRSDHTERVFRWRSEIWRLVAGSREALARSQQLIADVEVALARGGDRPPAKPKLCEKLDVAQEANTCFRLAECESNAGVRTILMGMGYGWLTLTHQDRQR